MKKKHQIWIALILIFAASGLIHSDTQSLSDGLYNYLENYFNNKNKVNIAVVKFENKSELSDFAAQRLYQIMVSRLENSTRFNYYDLLIDLKDKQGKFNLKNTEKIDYFLFLRVIRNKRNLGLGTAIFSNNLKKIENIKYIEENVSSEEISILDIKDLGFNQTGFFRISEISVSNNLLDVIFLNNFKNKNVCLLFYPDRIDFFTLSENQFIKISKLDLQWPAPFYPVKEFEGRASVFIADDGKYLTFGTNFSKKSKIFKIGNSEILEIEGLDFVPLAKIQMNEKDVLIGARYNPGTNYFQDTLFFKPLPLKSEELFEKTVEEFFSIGIIKNQATLSGFFLVDRNFKLRTYLSDFEEKNVFDQKVGSAVMGINNDWLVYSDYSKGKDVLYFADIGTGGFQVTYSIPIDGEILFLSQGNWIDKPGIWALINKKTRNNDFKLVFYGKK